MGRSVKVFRVITEHEGNTVSAPGASKTEIIRQDHIYVAENMSDVWTDTLWLRSSGEYEIIAIIEEYPSCTIIKPEEA